MDCPVTTSGKQRKNTIQLNWLTWWMMRLRNDLTFLERRGRDTPVPVSHQVWPTRWLWNLGLIKRAGLLRSAYECNEQFHCEADDR